MLAFLPLEKEICFYFQVTRTLKQGTQMLPSHTSNTLHTAALNQRVASKDNGTNLLF